MQDEQDNHLDGDVVDIGKLSQTEQTNHVNGEAEDIGIQPLTSMQDLGSTRKLSEQTNHVNGDVVEIGIQPVTSMPEITPTRKEIGPRIRTKLMFQDIEYCAKSKQILNKISGGVLPGQILAILGASGSGKSTLLDVLADRKIKGGKFTGGTTTLNDRAVPGSERRKMLGLVAQDDALLGGFSVRETFWFSARLVYGYKKTREELGDMVEEMISIMGLASCANVRIGNAILRGISGGQRRRVSIGVELLARHPVILLDEPTSGLDSVAAFAIVEQLKNIANAGHAIIATIHQPSSAIFEMFDSVLLLSKGRTVYFGPAATVTQCFADEFGMSIPDFFNPADFIVDCVSDNFSLQKDARVMTPEEMSDKYALSSYKIQAMSIISNASFMPLDSNVAEQPHASFTSQTTTLIHRGVLNLAKNPGIVFVRLALYVLLSVACGLAFSGNRGLSNDVAIQAINSTIFFVPGLFAFLSCAAVPFYVEEKPVFFREYKSGLTSITSYAIASVICSIPATIVLTISTGVIIFFMVDLQNFGQFILIWWLVFLMCEAFAMTVSILSPHYMVGLILCCGFWGAALVVSGFLTVFTQITWAIRWLGYVTPLRYFFQAGMRNQWQDFGNLTSLAFPNGEAIIEFYDLNASLYQNYWVDVAIMCVFQLAFLGSFISACNLVLNH